MASTKRRLALIGSLALAAALSVALFVRFSNSHDNSVKPATKLVGNGDVRSKAHDRKSARNPEDGGDTDEDSDRSFWIQEECGDPCVVVKDGAAATIGKRRPPVAERIREIAKNATTLDLIETMAREYLRAGYDSESSAAASWALDLQLAENKNVLAAIGDALVSGKLPIAAVQRLLVVLSRSHHSESVDLLLELLQTKQGCIPCRLFVAALAAGGAKDQHPVDKLIGMLDNEPEGTKLSYFHDPCGYTSVPLRHDVVAAFLQLFDYELPLWTDYWDRVSLVDAFGGILYTERQSLSKGVQRAADDPSVAWPGQLRQRLLCQLEQGVDSVDERLAVLSALGQNDTAPETVEALLRHLHADPSERVRARCVSYLVDVPPELADRVEKKLWEIVLNDPSELVKTEALKRLPHTAEVAARLITKAAEKLRGQGPVDHNQAVSLLESAGEPALPHLEMMAVSEEYDADVRENARHAILRIKMRSK
jgi:hypothetical protein